MNKTTLNPTKLGTYLLKPIQRVSQTIWEKHFKIFWANISSGGMFKLPPSIIVHVAAMQTQQAWNVRA